MGFDGPLGYIQVASDLGVVAPLQQQIDDLLLPWAHLFNPFFH